MAIVSYVYVNRGKLTGISGVGFSWPINTTDSDIAGAKSGDLIVWNGLVGVALTDYDADLDEIMVDWAGGYKFPVYAESADIQVMQKVYYDAAAGILNDDNTGIFVGYALEPVAYLNNKVINIKFEM